jgi:hypothetical protein
MVPRRYPCVGVSVYQSRLQNHPPKKTGRAPVMTPSPKLLRHALAGDEISAKTVSGLIGDLQRVFRENGLLLSVTRFC